jgi:hypothetical protein
MTPQDDLLFKSAWQKFKSGAGAMMSPAEKEVFLHFGSDRDAKALEAALAVKAAPPPPAPTPAAKKVVSRVFLKKVLEAYSKQVMSALRERDAEIGALKQRLTGLEAEVAHVATREVGV